LALATSSNLATAADGSMRFALMVLVLMVGA
jgi:hypothetical protein